MPGLLAKHRWLLLNCVALIGLSACGAGGSAQISSSTPVAVSPSAISTPSATISASPTSAPSATSVVSTPTDVPTATVLPSSTPQPTMAVSKLDALYPCDAGLCRATLGDMAVRTVVAVDSSTQALAGYAPSADGTMLVYGLDATQSGTATLYLAHDDGSQPQQLFDVKGTESGAGGLEGYGALGLSANNSHIIFEDGAQVFVAKLDGSERKAITEQITYGASSTHYYYLSPQRTSMMFVSTNQPDSVTIYHPPDSTSQIYQLDPAQHAEGFLGDDTHLLAVHYDPPFDPQGSNPDTIDRTTLGYDEIELGGTTAQSRSLFSMQKADSFAVLSNVVGGKVIRGDTSGTLELLDLASGTRTPVALPGHQIYDRITLFVPAS